MEILLFGATGQLGRALQRTLAPLGNVIAPARGGACWHADFDCPAGLADTVDALRPQLIVNAAAWTAVDAAEQAPEAAFRVNAEAVGVLARAAAAQGALLVHYSTDYVFDGSGTRPWHEDDRTGPLNVYGASKLAGERLLRGSGCAHLILRTAWVYAAQHANFVATVRERLLRGEALRVVDDQIGAPTPAALVAEVTAAVVPRVLVAPALGDTYHLTAAGEASWHGVASFIADDLRARGHDVIAPLPVPTASRPLPARRPLNSRLDTARLRRAFGLTLPAWPALLAQTLAAWPPG